LNWEIAADKLLKMEAGNDPDKECSVADAIQSFIDDCELRNLKKGTTVKYQQTLNQLSLFAIGQGISTVRALADLETLKKFIAIQTDSPRTLGKKIERIRTFFRYCEDLDWCEKNPANKIKRPRVQNKPVVPFTAQQYEKILKTIPKYPINNNCQNYRERLRAFILTLRYTGLRISDVVQLKKASVSDCRILLNTQKTGTPVHLPLPPSVVEALEGIGNGEFYFWSGNSQLKAAVGGWQRSILKLFRLAGINGHPHMFRHMLAIELLENGVTVEHVAAILGNTPAIVYKHYSPWVPSRQKALDSAVQTVWKAKAKAATKK
jgi:integrase/recombinase XerD